MYYNTLFNLAPHRREVVDPDLFEYIQGYAKISEMRPIETTPGSGIYDKVIINLVKDKINAGNFLSVNVQPFSRKAWQVMKEALPLAMFPEDDLQTIYAKDNKINCGDFDDLDAGNEIADLHDDSRNHKKNAMSFPNIYNMMNRTGFASRAKANKSWVRLRSGRQSKIGGGSRVKSIKVYDNWDEFVQGENESVYGTKYDYTTTDARGNTVSSGVASYEPLNGGDENAMRHPKYYIHDGKGVPNERYYTEFPLNEEIFASADVRYSEVKVSSIDYNGLAINTPGYTKHTHYTAKDFPIQFDYTDPQNVVKKPGAVNLLGISKRRFGFSYGMSVVTNDMHGKFKGKYVHSAPTPNNPAGNLIFKEEHFYRTDAEGKLNSEVDVIHQDGTRDKQLMGMNLDVMTHLNSAESNTSNVNVDANLEFNLPFITGVFIWPGGNTSENTIYSTLTTKVIYQLGILDDVIVEDNGRQKSTKNLLFDAKTGLPITTVTTPEQGDVVQKFYNYTYPAHWAYPGMEIGSENVNLKLANILNGGGEIIPQYKPYYFPGDEVLVNELIPGSGFSFVGKYTVLDNESTGAYALINDAGAVFQPATNNLHLYRVFIPGRQNLSSATMATVNTMNSFPDANGPYGNSPYGTLYPHSNIVSITGWEFYDEAKLLGNCYEMNSAINPYRYNLRGQWKAKDTYVFDHDRNYNTGISREDGLLTTYQPFWKNESGKWYPIHSPNRSDYNPQKPLQNWIHTAEATLHDNYSNAIENEDVIENPSAQYLGYNNQHVKASVVNSRYEESGFDGFEDYISSGVLKEGSFQEFNCVNRHFRVDTYQPEIVDNEAHTGRYSLKVDGGRSQIFQSEVWNGNTPGALHGIPFQIAEADRLLTHRFINDKPSNVYVVTGWVKESQVVQGQTTYASSITLDVGGQSLPFDEKRTHIIDGWQRIELTFNIDPSVANGTPVAIQLNSGGSTAYFDDIRVQPYESEMEANVIDAIHQRPVATLDNRNFATIFQYDEDGNLVRTIKETERGKQTISEKRIGIRIYE